MMNGSAASPAVATSGAASRGDTDCPDAAGDAGDPRRRGALVGLDHRHGVGLAGGHIHLADAEARQQHDDRQLQGGHERHQDEQDVGGHVREDHRVDEPDARRQRRRQQGRDAGQDVGSEEDETQHRRIGAEPDVEPEGDEALHHEAATEGVEREEQREPRHHAARLVESQPRGHRDIDGARCLDLDRDAPEADGQQDAHARVHQHHRPVAVEGADAAVLEGLRQQAGQQRAGRGRERPDKVVPGEDTRALPVGQRLRQGRLLDREERPDLVAAGADDADGRRQQQHPEVVADREDGARQDHQQGSRDEHPATAQTVRVRRQPQADGRVADQRQGQDEAHLEAVQTQRREVQAQHHRQEAVAEHARAAGREQEATVARQHVQKRRRRADRGPLRMARLC